MCLLTCHKCSEKANEKMLTCKLEWLLFGSIHVGGERERDRDERVLDSILIVFFLLYLLCIFYQETNAWICPKVMAEEDCRFYWLMVVKVEASELMEVFWNALRLIKAVADVGNLMMLFLLKPSLIFLNAQKMKFYEVF